jgi:hypothetical protein
LTLTSIVPDYSEEPPRVAEIVVEERMITTPSAGNPARQEVSEYEAAAPTMGPEGYNTTFIQAWQLWFGPEIGRRQTEGTLPSAPMIYMAQALFSPERKVRVLLNDEVRGEGLLRAPRSIEKGEPLYSNDLQYIERFKLPDELLDSGHFTIVRAGGGWRAFFNFLSGRAKAKDMLELAGQFLEAALSAKDKGHAGPAVDNLFSACELTSKAELIIHRNPAASSKTHGVVASEINRWKRLGNIDAAFVDLFNRMHQQRPNARYGDKEHRPPVPEEDSFDVVKTMIERGLGKVGKATARPGEERW